jgi:DNA repair protein RecN (Recombination protein N)
MLRELRIRDFAIIDDLAVSFRPGLNALTGETGAGKSIIMQALTLLCGARGASDLIRSDADEASIEGLFECALPGDLGESLGIEDGEILVRRQLTRSGKSRVYVNGSPATVALLAQLGDSLVHIYGQLEQAQLLRPASHLELLDRFAALGAQRQRMADAYGATAPRASAWNGWNRRAPRSPSGATCWSSSTPSSPTRWCRPARKPSCAASASFCVTPSASSRSAARVRRCSTRDTRRPRRRSPAWVPSSPS